MSLMGTKMGNSNRTDSRKQTVAARTAMDSKLVSKIVTGFFVFSFAFFGGHNVFGYQAVTQKKEKNSSKVAQKKQKGKRKFSSDRYVRIAKDKKGKPLALQTSTITLTKDLPDGTKLTVELIGVVHIGHKKYYKDFNQQFGQYDALLYELVAPKGTKISKRKKGSGLNPVAALQKGMMAGLDLKFQLDHIDYDKSNFVHADMTPDEFSASMKKNNESMMAVMFRSIGMAVGSQGKNSSDIELMRAMMSTGKDRIYRIRAVAAKQLMNMDAGMSIWKGDNGSTIITHRNTKALEVMKQQIALGKRRIGIFYGAGHLKDMEKRLVEEHQMSVGKIKWADAWHLQESKK